MSRHIFRARAIALAADVPVRTLQEFLSQLRWDQDRLHELYQHLIADRHACEGAIGVIDASGHPKQGDKTPGGIAAILR
jgi:hypothetical protein